MATRQFGYRMATLLPGPIQSDETQAGAWLPEFSLRNGKLVLERGLHQEIGWERNTDASGMAVLVFADKIRNPVLEAMGALCRRRFRRDAGCRAV